MADETKTETNDDILNLPDFMPTTEDAPEPPGEIVEVSYGNFC